MTNLTIEELRKIYLGKEDMTDAELISFHEEEYAKMQTEAENMYKAKKLKAEREKMLKVGTTTADGKLWFNIETAQMFVSGASTLDAGESFLWRDANREVVKLSYADVKAYAKEIRVTLQKFYGLEK